MSHVDFIYYNFHHLPGIHWWSTQFGVVVVVVVGWWGGGLWWWGVGGWWLWWWWGWGWWWWWWWWWGWVGGGDCWVFVQLQYFQQNIAISSFKAILYIKHHKPNIRPAYIHSMILRTGFQLLSRKHSRKLFLTHLPWTKWPPLWQTTIENAFSWMKIIEYRFEFHWNLFPGDELTISQHWFR